MPVKVGFMNTSGNGKGGFNPVYAFLAGTAVAGICYLIWREKSPLTMKDVFENAKASFNPNFSQEAEGSHKKPDFDNSKSPFLCLGRWFRQGGLFAVVSDPGVGKTLFAISIVKNPVLKKTLFIEIDDPSGNQTPRFAEIPSVHLITHEMWYRELEKLRAFITGQCTVKALWDTVQKPLQLILDRRRRLMAQCGIKEEKDCDNLLLFELLMESELGRSADAVVLDSLNGMFAHPSKINRENVSRIIAQFSGTGKTLLVLHHRNKKKEIAGGVGFSQLMETVLVMEDMGGNLRNIRAEKTRHYGENTSCVVEMIRLDDHRAEFRVCEDLSMNAETDTPNLETLVLCAVKEGETMTFSDLCAELEKTAGRLNPGSVKNSLKRLMDKRLVCMTDGKTWESVTRCVYSEEV